MVTLAAALATAACEAKKSENPLSPNVAGPIAGVSISVPAPVSPVNGAEVLNTSPLRLTFANSTSNGVRPVWYIVEVSSDATFATKLYTNGRVQPQDGPHTSTVVDTSLAAGATYFWRVRADDGANNSTFSSAAHFDWVVPVALGPPGAVEPENGVTISSRTPTLRVQNGTVAGRAGQIEYRFELATDQAFSAMAAILTVPAGQTTTSVTTTELPAATTFYWRARATNGTVTSAPSATMSFRTPTGECPSAENGMTPELQAYVLNRIEWLRVQYPQAWYLAHRHIDINGNRTNVSYHDATRFAHIVAWDLYTHVSPRFGLNGKRGDPTQLSMDAFAFRRGALSNVRDVIIIDYIVNAGIDDARVDWGDVTAVSQPYGGGIWVQPHRPSEYRH